jgi:hypothetical protein
MRLPLACLPMALLLACARAAAPAPRDASQEAPARAGEGEQREPVAGPGGGEAAEPRPDRQDGGAGRATGVGEVQRYRLRDNGVRCITYPCPSIDAIPLEGGAPVQVHEVDLSALGLSDAARDEALARLSGKGLVVRGRIDTVPARGPAGAALVVRVEALESPLEPRRPPLRRPGSPRRPGAPASQAPRAYQAPMPPRQWTSRKPARRSSSVAVAARPPAAQ